MHKDLAVLFLKTVVDRKIEEAYAQYAAPDMRHHNAYFPGDTESLQKGMIETHAQFPETTINIKHAIEEGDLVAVFSNVIMRPNGPSVAVVHMFRFENGKIVEMWDVGQLVPDDSPNQNGMF